MSTSASRSSSVTREKGRASGSEARSTTPEGRRSAVGGRRSSVGVGVGFARRRTRF